ncbi:MAG: uL15 family ribosomal protein [Patescibacteria group bacterium]|nr:uL15 family ribosomal protein [Patescibacteria group bacterium]
MQIHQLKQNNKRKSKKRVGRGGKRGTYSGKGVKGQKSRAGRKLQPSMRELIKRYPKVRGYRQIKRLRLTKAVGFDVLEKNFQAGDKITPEILLEKKIVRRIRGKVPQIKIVAKGEMAKSFDIAGCRISKKAGLKVKS